MAEKTVTKLHREPLFHIVKRDDMVWWKAWGIRAIAIVAALIVCGFLTVTLTRLNPLDVYITMAKGAVGTPRLIWNLLQNTAILLCISLAVTPAFKMKFWNCGAEGQVLISGLATTAVMMFLGDSIPYPVPVEVEKKLTWWERQKLEYGGFAIGVAVFFGFIIGSVLLGGRKRD